MKNKMTEETAMMRLADYCAKAEHCSYELLTQLKKWEIAEAAQIRILRDLQSRRYFDDERYARAYVHDKLQYNKWGRRKIEEGLYQKHISEEIRQHVLDEVDTDEFVSILRPLLKQKRKSIKGDSDYERTQRLIRFALGRGFTFDIIRQCIDVDEEYMDD